MKKYFFAVGIILICAVIALVFGIHEDEYISVYFNTLYFHTPMKLETVTYADIEYLGAPIVFDEAEELETWEEGFLKQLNNTSFKRGNCYLASSMDGVIITFEFKGYDEKLKVVFKEPNDIRILEFGWISNDKLDIPFERESAEELFGDKYPDGYLQQFE